MKNIIIPIALIGALVVAMVATVSNRSSAADQPELAAPVLTMAPADPYGAPLEGDTATEATPAAPMVWATVFRERMAESGLSTFSL